MNAIKNFVVIFLFAALGNPTHGEENKDLTATVKYHASVIKQSVDLERWTVQESPAAIVIESKFKVEIKRRISPALGEEPRFETYRIELRFQPMLSKDDYVKLAQKRIEYVASAYYGTSTKEESMNVRKFLKENPLPHYYTLDRLGKSYSVYLFTSDCRSISIVPTATYVEVKSIEAILEHIF